MDLIKNIKNVVVGNMKKEIELEKEIIVTEALMRLTILEKLLISKGIITQEEIASAMEEITHQVAKILLEKANVPGDLDQILDSIKSKKPIEN